MGDYVRWAGVWTLHGSIHELRFRSLLGYETIGFECGVDAGEGGDQLALKDARSDSIGYLRDRVCVCFLPIHSGHQVRWTYHPGSHRRKVQHDFSSTFFLRCVS